MSSPDRLVYMANQIGKFFQSQGHDKALPGIAEHIKKFWDPRMRKAIFPILTPAAPGWIRSCVMQSKSCRAANLTDAGYELPELPHLAGFQRARLVFERFQLRVKVPWLAHHMLRKLSMSDDN